MPADGSGKTQTEQHSGSIRTVTVADSIEMTSSESAAKFSPDGTKFVVVLRKGNLEKNTNQYSLVLWRTEGIFHSASAQTLVTMSSSSNRPAIQNITWMQDNTTIAFLGENPGDVQQVYTVNTVTHIVSKLTSHPTSLLCYSMTPQKDRFAYVAEAPIESLVDVQARRKGIVISAQRLDLLLGGKQGPGFDTNQLFVEDAQRVRRVALSAKIANDPECAISPDGKYVISEGNVDNFPESWKEYTDSYLQVFTQKQLAPGEVSFLRKYVVIDTSTGQARTLLDSPIRWLSSVTWSPDSKSVVLAGVYLPLDNTNGEERKKRRFTRFVVEVQIPGIEVSKIEDEDEASGHFNQLDDGNITRTTEWDPTTGNLTHVLHDWERSTDLELVFHKGGGHWSEVKKTVPDELRPEVVLEQDMNHPPRLFAIDRATRQKVLLLDLNPQFSGLKFARVEAIQWKASDGHIVNGGLYYPVDYVKGTRYPLVIQTHGWEPTKFWIDGPFTTAFAAQELAGKGMMVLQADEMVGGSDWGTVQEVNREVATFEGAIDSLDDKGLIDRNRVGIIGFSRTGTFLSYALTRSKYRFAAASVADGSDFGPCEFRLIANVSRDYILSFEKFYGGLPFGEHLESWLALSPEFHFDQVRTPLRMLATGPEMLIAQWGWFTSLLALGKPVEMLYVPEGDHVLEKPWDRMLSQQGNVDWFSFWLKGEEDPDPTKAEEYRRWRKLRDLSLIAGLQQQR
jgi:dipeptidyl aminopeptidase/acylaminoacyl peptidase